MDNEENKNFLKKQKYKEKKGSRYENRILIYIVLIVFILINFFLTPFTSDIEIPNNEMSNINSNLENNDKIKESSNPSFNNKKDDIKEDKNKNIQTGEKNEDKNNKLNDREKMKYINKSTRSFFQKFEMLSLFGFIGILLGLMWHNANKAGNENIENNNNSSYNNVKDKDKLYDKNKYHLLKDFDEVDYYENI